MSQDKTTPVHQIDHDEMARIFSEVASRSSKVLGDYMKKNAETQKSLIADEFGIARAFMDMWQKMFADPSKMVEAQAAMLRDYLTLWQNSWLKMLGQQVEPVMQPAKSDSRFKGEEWQNNFLFDYIKQSYLIAARHIHDSVSNVEGVSDESRKKVNFFTRQYIDALAPTNFALTNPQVIKETVRTSGTNLVKGLNNLLKDIEAGDGQLRVKMVDDKAFKVGMNVATASGKVIYQNELMQLVQFAPTTEKQFKRPLLIVPPWINKYYILDLRESNSFIRWATAQGHTVFVISWVNPDENLSHKKFDDYMLEGPIAALDAIEEAVGEKEVNTIGYCLGGTLLASTLAYMAAKNDKRIVSATYFVALLDFSIPGELGVFIDEKQLDNIDKLMKQRGFLEGSEMAGTFNMLRSNDLIWTFVVNNYLMGKEPFPFDLLYWNSDSTRMPATMHSFYLRNMYLKNRLRVPGGIELAGVPIDLAQVKVPSYFISTAEDHIAPWKGTYLGAQALGGPIRFVLGGSGHIAGIVNPPSANKYGFWTNDVDMHTVKADEWQAGATQQPGSWWVDWEKWIAGLNKNQMGAARVPGEGKLKALEDAPGSFVAIRLSTTKAKELPAR